MNNSEDIIILAIESSCDDTSCAVLKNNVLLSNITAGQAIHEQYGGVVPELASRDHQKNIVPVADAAIKKAGVNLSQISAIAFTRGPGLSGSLLVGMSFAKSLSLALNIPLIEVNHMQGHILAHFILDNHTAQKNPAQAKTPSQHPALHTPPLPSSISPFPSSVPSFPFLCLTVSGGHTQIVKISDHLSFELIAETEDDAVGEAFDKAAKILGLPYPGGPLIDRHALQGNADRFKFPVPHVPDNNYSFSGVKTSFLYFIQNGLKANPHFISENLADICASYQQHLVNYLLKNLKAVAHETGIKEIAIAGGVSANSGLRKALGELGEAQGWHVYIPKFEYCTDNAAMIGITGYYKFLRKEFCRLDATPLARYAI